ncbi:hypothetical protein ACPOL_4161 [Acidisarcina polymorpha]|uniref:Uncharacterized protein n=1 Tax=Acidisarcina polymorpha TaxID=2211140 RepID=A0A2Z5G2W1_9BACT|nr:hypothetical protein ACPOL_4161 [Acidisarcina polymorpha]
MGAALLEPDDSLTMIAKHVQQAYVFLIHLFSEGALLVLNPLHAALQSIVAPLPEQYPKQHREGGYGEDC